MAVKAVCEDGQSAYTDRVYFTTLAEEIEPECLEPYNVDADDITSQSAKITWTPQGDET